MSQSVALRRSAKYAASEYLWLHIGDGGVSGSELL